MFPCLASQVIYPDRNRVRKCVVLSEGKENDVHEGSLSTEVNLIPFAQSCVPDRNKEIEWM